MATTKRKKKKRTYPKLSPEERARRVERCKAMQPKAAYEKTVVFRVVVDHFENKPAVVRFEYKNERYRPSLRRLRYVWRDIVKYYKYWQYTIKKEELPKFLAEKAAAEKAEVKKQEVEKPVVINETTELDEVLVNG